VIDAMQNVFATHSNPKDLIADNNPFKSRECDAYFRSVEWQKKLLEFAARCCKRVMRMVLTSQIHCKHYRNTPLLGGIDASPAQILFSCRIRTDLPTTSKALEPIIQVNVYDALCSKQAKVKLNYDKTASRKEIHFKKGKNVVIRAENDKYWEKGQIMSKGTKIILGETA
jgi:hypothetical protein